ncbi:DJ-1/PfpI family protein [Brevibacillus brevis]|uniref:DJ-1/PfpI family protein n=1 Tax=Brevibacillus brevis TaxID=1393 RepID=A0ABY9TDG0_BREBE|nr:DJ-1/PfpI family protein [Brevibacillus brevis]WNC17579.1 DJ-1/PfpI family protein [Brevibacillus brevis]
MKKVILRIVLYLAMVVLVVGGSGVLGYIAEQKAYWYAFRQEPVPLGLQPISIPKYDPKKPTAAVLLGSASTEVFDFMVPYEMLAMTEAYNVYAVAPTKSVTPLTGGLDLMPHYTFDEMDQLLGKSPDLIVLPYMPLGDPEKYQPVRQWIQKHSHTYILSICGGAINLADSGLLKGKSSTVHWQYFDQTKRFFPETNWIRDQRYVIGAEKMVSSAGLTSGIDATLYVISKQLGEDKAKQIAETLKYPSYHFVQHPQVDPYSIDGNEIVYLLNQAFQWNKKNIGVLLYDGMDDGELSTIYDTYAASGTSRVISLAETVQPIVTKHHLNLIPKYAMKEAPDLDRLIVPGKEAEALAAGAVKQWREKAGATKPEFLHQGSADRFMFDAPLEDLARQEDQLTAKYGTKRLEYRANSLRFEGMPFSVESFGVPLLLAISALAAAFLIERRFIGKDGRQMASQK